MTVSMGAEIDVDLSGVTTAGVIGVYGNDVVALDMRSVETIDTLHLAGNSDVAVMRFDSLVTIREHRSQRGACRPGNRQPHRGRGCPLHR